MKRVTFGSVCGGKDNNFDFLRAFLATVVIWFHCYYLLFGGWGQDPLFRATRGQMYSGEVAVDFFFLISGFLITASWLRSRGARDFAAKRLLRLYPGAAVVVLFCLFVVEPLGTNHARAALGHTALPRVAVDVATLRVPAAAGVFATLPEPGKINASLWTIKFELLCYLLTALFGVTGVLRRPRLVLALALASWLALAWQMHFHLFDSGEGSGMAHGALMACPRFLTYYMAGMLFYLYRDAIVYSKKAMLMCAAALAVSAAWGGLAYLLPLCGAYVLFHTAFNASIPARRFGRHGDFSYGLYLYSFPLQQMLLQHFRHDFTPLSLFMVVFPLTLALAAFSWHMVEKPFLRKKHRVTAPVLAYAEPAMA